MGEISRVSSGAPWEKKVGYSRAVRAGDLLEIAGTTSSEGERIMGKDAKQQTEIILQKIDKVLKGFGAGPAEVVRTRIYTSTIEQWEGIGQAHADYFGEHRPATSLIGIKDLVNEKMLVEIEITAWLKK